MPVSEVKVVLINYTPSPQETIAMAAKQCYSDADLDELRQKIEEKDQSKFIKRLVNVGHFATFEHASFTFGISGVSRSLLAQITRHRIASFCVKSQRYVGVQSAKNGGFEFVIPPKIKALGKEYEQKFIDQMATIQSYYDEWSDLLGNEGEKTNEDARFVLPNACATQMLVTMNARELLHFFSLRGCNRAQWEIREVSRLMLKEAYKVAPIIFENAGPGCLTGNCPEGTKTCGKQAEIKELYKNLKSNESC